MDMNNTPETNTMKAPACMRSHVTMMTALPVGTLPASFYAESIDTLTKQQENVTDTETISFLESNDTRLAQMFCQPEWVSVMTKDDLLKSEFEAGHVKSITDIIRITQACLLRGDFSEKIVNLFMGR
jgi:hypothetical protein